MGGDCGGTDLMERATSLSVRPSGLMKEASVQRDFKALSRMAAEIDSSLLSAPPTCVDVRLGFKLDQILSMRQRQFRLRCSCRHASGSLQTARRSCFALQTPRRALPRQGAPTQAEARTSKRSLSAWKSITKIRVKKSEIKPPGARLQRKLCAPKCRRILYTMSNVAGFDALTFKPLR